MTQTALSGCSYPESTAYNIREEIDVTITRLKVVIDEEASLRKTLRTLFVKRKEEATEQVRLANLHLYLVNEEETAFCEDLKQATAIANEGSVSSASVMMRETIKPTVLPVLTGTPKDDEFPTELHNCNQEPPQSPRKSTCGLTEDGHDDGTRHCFDEPPKSIARSTNPFGPPTSSGQFLPRMEPTRSRSPGQSVHGDDYVPGTNSPAWYNRKFHDDIPHHSPALSAGGLRDSHFPLDAPSHSQRTPEMNPTSPPADLFGGNYGAAIETPEELPVREPSPTPAPREPPAVVVAPKKKKKGKKLKKTVADFLTPETPAVDAYAEERALMEERRLAEEDKPVEELKQLEAEEAELAEQEKLEEARLEQKKSPAHPSATLPATLSFNGGGFGSGPTANTGFGFGLSPPVGTNFGFGASPITDTAFAFGVPSQSPSATIGFGAASLAIAGFGFASASQTSPAINFGLRPCHPTFDSNISSFGATTQSMETPTAADDLGDSNELFDDIMKNAAGEDWGFEVPADEDDAAEYDAARGQSPKVLADNYLGEQLDSGYQHDDIGATGDGGAGQNEGVDGDYEFINQQTTPPAREPSPIPEPPKEPLAVVVAPKKKKKGKKHKKEPADTRAPEPSAVDTDSEERAMKEEQRLTERHEIEEELRPLAAEAAEWAERERLEELRRSAEAAAVEREERMLAEEEARDHRVYIILMEETAKAQERLAMVQEELGTIEARRDEMIQQLESARMKEASCAYQTLLRDKQTAQNNW